MITLSQCKKNCAGRDFSGGPVVKTPYFHRAQVQSLVGQLSSHALRGMAKINTTVVLEVRIMVAPDRGQHMGGASGELGMFPFLTWILVQAFVCEKYILLQIDNSYSVHFYLLSRIVYS